ncbi:MAG: prephenate dehydrogenase/arogenate dehydrogenase family protein [Desulfobacterota bacterium]|jgi:prephenate dehydrogenase|nr:prephenate dehydrogenase/arogenate dehydrogenase family protein [Thermodesulfobacteriota bacterium]
MKIFILGAGRMGAWLVEALCLDHDVAVFDLDPHKLQYFFRARKISDLAEIRDFAPEMMINAVNLAQTGPAFEEALPYLPEDCLLADIASVKTGLKERYRSLGKRFVSTHPMFGPTFADVRNLEREHAVVIRESDPLGKKFFRDFFQDLRLHVHEYSFEEHDETIAYSLSVPFASTLVFAACMKKQEAPGTTFRRHMDIARGLFAEDDQLLSEILFNPATIRQIERINSRLSFLTHVIRERDGEELQRFLDKLRRNIA